MERFELAVGQPGALNQFGSTDASPSRFSPRRGTAKACSALPRGRPYQCAVFRVRTLRAHAWHQTVTVPLHVLPVSALVAVNTIVSVPP